MATGRGFQLPSWGSLSAEQEAIVNMPTSRDYVVQGSPGTGKTVMALYRAARIAQRDHCDVTILVYNRPLMLYMETAIESNSQLKNVKVNTWHSWLDEFFKAHFGMSTPKTAPFEPEWNTVKDYCIRVPNSISHIIMDEAQDFPIELVECLKIVAKNITCFIDPNQAILVGKTSVIETLKTLFVECPKNLTTNYRNTKPIADLSKLYWNGKGVFAEPNTSGVGASKPRMVKLNNFDEVTKIIVDIYKNHKEKNIGIFTNNSWLNKTYASLTDAGMPVMMFKAWTPGAKAFGFDNNDPKLLSFGTMKGLEFDLVIVSNFDMMEASGDPDTDMNRAYVAITRACTDLRLLYFKTKTGLKWAPVMGKVTANKQLCTWE